MRIAESAILDVCKIDVSFHAIRMAKCGKKFRKKLNTYIHYNYTTEAENKSLFSYTRQKKKKEKETHTVKHIIFSAGRGAPDSFS